MAVPLFIFTKEEQTAVVILLWAEGVRGIEIYRRLCDQYGLNVFRHQGVLLLHDNACPNCCLYQVSLSLE
jgi:hypothetical protein